MERSQEDAENLEERNYLKRVLTSEEYATIQQEVAQKIEASIQESFEEFITQKALLESSKIQHDEEIKSIKQELFDRSSELEKTTTELQKANDEIQKLEESLSEAIDQVQKVEETNKQLEYEWKDFKIQRDLAKDEREGLMQMVDRRNSELSHLKTVMEDLQTQLDHAIKAKLVALENAEEVESLKISLEYKEKRIEQESNMLHSQMKALNDELDKKTSEILSLKRSNSMRAVATESEIAEKIEELKIAQEMISTLKETNSSLTSRVENLLEKQQQQRQENEQMFVQFNEELHAQTKLANLYKGLCDENESKTQKLTASIDELQDILKDAIKRYGDLETEKLEQVLKLEVDLSKKNECIKLLKKELKDANDLLQAAKQETMDATVANLSPCAASASKLIKSGMTLTQIYTQYATITEELIIEKEENKKLKLFMTTILQEIEDKAPILQQQQQDYEKAMANVESLTKQMDEMLVEADILHRENSEAKKTSAYLTRENQRLKKELADLARQVCYLVKAVEEARGGVVSDLDGSNVSYDDDGGSSAQYVISKKLVTFSSIEDLQTNNQKLLALVRQLSSKLEQSEDVSTDDYKDLKIKEEKLQKRIADLMDEMERQSKMLELLKNQSLRYKTLYEQAMGKFPDSPLKAEKTTPVKQSPGIVTSTPKSLVMDETMEQPKQVIELEERLKKLTDENANIKEKMKNTVEKLNEEVEGLRKEVKELILKNSKMTYQIEYNEEKCKVLETNIKLYKKQIEALEDKNRTLSEINAKHEQSLVYLKDEALNAQSKLSRLEITADNLKEENFLLKSAEQRLLKEKEGWHREQHSFSLLHTNLDSIKAFFAKSEAEGKLRLEVQLSEALKECSALRNTLLEEKDKFRELTASLERQTAAAKEQMLEEKNFADKARNELQSVKDELESKKKTIEALHLKLREISNEPTKSTIESVTMNLDASTKKIKELEKKLTDAEAENSSLQQLLQASKQHGAQYAEMADVLEKQLTEAKEEHELYKKLMAERLEEAIKRESCVTEKYKELENKYASETKNRLSSAEELSAKLADSNTELKSTSSELSDLRNELADTKEKYEKASSEIKKLTSALETTEAKYSDQMFLHSSDLQALSAAKAKLTEVTQSIATLQRERDDALEALKLKMDSWNSQEQKFVEEVNELNTRLKDLDEQNVILHNKIQDLGSQITILQAQVPDGSSKLIETSFSGDTSELRPESQDQLLKVMKFIRQEKDVAVARSEVLNAENARLKSQLSITSKKLEDAESEAKLRQEASKSVTEKASVKHVELLRKIDTLNAVTDSNRILREERDKFKADLMTIKEELDKAKQRISESAVEEKKLADKMDALVTENKNLLIDAARWKQKATILAERSNKTTPEDWRRLTNERENLAKQWQLEKNNNEKLEEDLRKAKAEITALTDQLTEVRKSLEIESNEARRLTEEYNSTKAQLVKTTDLLNTSKIQLTKLFAEANKTSEEIREKELIIADLREKDLKLKRVGKKYKIQYEDLLKTSEEEKKKWEEEKAKQQEEEAMSVETKEKLRDEGRAEVRSELTVKLSEAESKLNDKIKELEAKVTSSTEETETLRKDNETLKTSINEKEERAKHVMKSARAKIATLQEQKHTLEMELSQMRGHMEQGRGRSVAGREEMETLSQGHISDESLKAQYESIISAMEKERLEQATERDRLTAQNKALNQRVHQLQRLLEKPQGSKPSTSSRPVEKSTMEPPTANIKPMAGSTTTARKQKQPTAQQSVVVGPCWRSAGNETPFASIRPTISMQTRTLAVLPTSQTSPASNSQPPATQSTPVLVPPQQQLVHTTGSSGEALSSSPTSSHTDYMPATSSAPAIRQVVVAPTPLSVGPPMGSDAQSTQEMEAEANETEVQQPSAIPGPSSQQPQHTQQQQTQTVAMVLPRERSEQQGTSLQGSQQSSVDQSCSAACSQANSSNTVTTTQAGLKRTRDVEGDSSTGLEGEELSKNVQPNKRTRISVTGSGNQAERTRVTVTGSGSQAEVFHHQVTHSEGNEVEYQVPTSSQRDQEDDMIIMVDSEEEGNADEGDVEEPDDEPEFEEEDNGEGYEIESYSHSHGRDVQELGMANYDEGPDIDEENVPDQDNNEVEIIDDSNEVPNQSGNSRDGGSDNGAATQSNSGAVPVASSVEVCQEAQLAQQSSEATSSGSVSAEQVVVSHAASSQSSASFRTRSVPPLGRQQQSQLMLPQVYEEGGDDSIVPSTPTLYVPRRADGFGEAVSSPQVPHLTSARFTFSDSTPPITRSGIPPASGEAMEEMVEEPGTGRSVPTTPLQASPQELPVGELMNEVVPSTSGEMMKVQAGDRPGASSNIPDITVTVAEDDGTGDMPHLVLLEPVEEEEESVEKDMSGEEPEVINLDEENDGVTSQGEKQPSNMGEIEEGREAEASEPFDSTTLRRPIGRLGATVRRSNRSGFPRRNNSRRPTPIVWNEPGSSSSSVGSPIPSIMRSNVPMGRISSPDPRQVPRGVRTLRRMRSWR